MLGASADAATKFDPKLIGLGGKAGVGATTVSGFGRPVESLTGYGIFGLANYPLAPFLIFQVEAGISRKGYRNPRASSGELRIILLPSRGAKAEDAAAASSPATQRRPTP